MVSNANRLVGRVFLFLLHLKRLFRSWLGVVRADGFKLGLCRR